VSTCWRLWEAPLWGRWSAAYLAQQFGLTAPFMVAFVAMVAMTAVAWRPLQQVSVRASAETPQA
jgi:hypothetical protein